MCTHKIGENEKQLIVYVNFFVHFCKISDCISGGIIVDKIGKISFLGIDLLISKSSETFSFKEP